MGVFIIYVFSLAEIETHVREMGDVEKGIRLQQNDMIKLNALMTKNRGKKEDLQQGNSLTENEFIQKLKVDYKREIIGRFKSSL